MNRRSRSRQQAPARSMRLALVGASLLAAVTAIEIFVLDKWFPQSATLDETARAQTPGAFDYYVLALSWSPAFCRENPGRDQCGDGRRLTLHGLWPQFEQGWPQDCPTRYRRPSDAELRANADLTGSTGLLAYQWRKHGACAGLPPAAYFDAARMAFATIRLPDALAQLERGGQTTPAAVQDAFLSANPALSADGVTVKCRNNRFSEVRICLTKDLSPRRCGRDVIRDCGARSIALDAPK